MLIFNVQRFEIENKNINYFDAAAFDSPSSPPNGSHMLDCSSRNSSGSRQSLSEDIHDIRFSLEGASSNAREKILKILERLTARLAQAETERDEVLGKGILFSE